MTENVKKGQFSGFILFLILLAAGGFILLKTVNNELKIKKSSLEKAILYLKSEYVFGKVERLSGNSYRVTIINIEGEPVGSRVVDLPGSDIYVESRIATVEYNGEERAFVFPARAYSDAVSEQNGVDLRPAYVRNGFPSIYTISSNDAEFEAVVREVYRQADGLMDMDIGTNERPFPSNLKIKMVMDAALHREPGSAGTRPMEMLVHPDGGLELREVK